MNVAWQNLKDGVRSIFLLIHFNLSAGNRRHFGPSIFLDVNILRSIEASISMYSTNNSSSRELVSGGPRSDTGLETVETTLH